MEQWAKIRRRVLVEGISKRQIIRETGMHWQTLEKILSHSVPPGYRRQKVYNSKLDAHIDWVRSVLDIDKTQPKKQRHTAKRIYELGRPQFSWTVNKTLLEWPHCPRRCKNG